MDKIKVLKTNVFVADNYVFPPHINPMFQKNRYMEVYIPITAIAYITQIEIGNPKSGYHVHFKKDYLDSFSFPVKSVSAPHLPADLIEVLT